LPAVVPVLPAAVSSTNALRLYPPRQRQRLSTVGAVCAIATVACFVLGAVAMGSSGVQLLMPETGKPGLAWIADVDAANGLFFTGPGSSS